MNLLVIVLPSALILYAAYLTYGRVLARLLRLSPDAVTPATQLRDGMDFEPIPVSGLLPQHFSAIAAAGPDRRSDSGRDAVRVAAGADLDSCRLDPHRRRA